MAVGSRYGLGARKASEFRDSGGRKPEVLIKLFFWRDLFLLTLTHYISKARRLPEKAAALTSVGRVLIGAEPLSRVGSGIAI